MVIVDGILILSRLVSAWELVFRIRCGCGCGNTVDIGFWN